MARKSYIYRILARFAYLQATRRTYEGDAPASELYTWLRYTSHQGSEQPLGLQVNVTTRYTRPYMYEWPWGIRADQHFAPSGTSLLRHWNTVTYAGPIHSSVPVTAVQLATGRQSRLNARVCALGSKLSILTKVDPKAFFVRWGRDDADSASGFRVRAPFTSMDFDGRMAIQRNVL